MSASQDSGLHVEIARLARSLHSQKASDLDAERLLEEVTVTAVRILPDVHHAGVSLIDVKSGRLRSVAATGPVPRQLDILQERRKQGPCVDAIHEHISVRVDDYQLELRWPDFVKEAVRSTSVRSSLSIQLYTHESEIGALNLYSERPSIFTAELSEHALAVAAHAAIGLSTARHNDQFRTALASRDIIGQAKGMLMERFDISAFAAFKLLVKLSQERNTPLHLIARQLVEHDHPT